MMVSCQMRAHTVTLVLTAFATAMPSSWQVFAAVDHAGVAALHLYDKHASKPLALVRRHDALAEEATVNGLGDTELHRAGKDDAQVGEKGNLVGEATVDEMGVPQLHWTADKSHNLVRSDKLVSGKAVSLKQPKGDSPEDAGGKEVSQTESQEGAVKDAPSQGSSKEEATGGPDRGPLILKILVILIPCLLVFVYIFVLRPVAEMYSPQNDDEPMHKQQRLRSGLFATFYAAHRREKDEAMTMISTKSEGGTRRVHEKMKPWIKQDFMNSKVAIIVSDMSGFTRLTREYGPVHFASIIIRMRQICLPILHKCGATLITTEADDFIVMFPSAAGAVKAACGMQKTVAKYNESLPADKKHFALTLNGIGVDFGPGPLVDEREKLFGQTIANAYALGEDHAEAGQVLVTGSVKDELFANKSFAGATYERAKHLDVEEVAENADGVYILNFDSGEDFSVPSFDDRQYLHPDLVALARRHNFALAESSLKSMDKEITDKYFMRRTVLMIAFDLSVSELPEVQMGLQYECMAKLRKILQKYEAEELEEELFLFADPVLAVKAAIEMREGVEADKSSQKGAKAESAYVKGYGIHEGNILFMPNTDVHWGDPVNTASKLGQDLATDGDMLVSDLVYKAVVNDVRMREVKFDLVHLNKSKVKFDCYKASKITKASGLVPDPPTGTNLYQAGANSRFVPDPPTGTSGPLSGKNAKTKQKFQAI